MNGTYYNTSNQFEGNNLTGFYIHLISFLSSCSLYFHQPKLDFLISISDLQLQFNFLVGCFISLKGGSEYACIQSISILLKLECLERTPILKRQFSLIQYTLHTMLHEVQCLIFVCQEGKVKYLGNRVIDVYWRYTLLMNI